MSWWQGTVLQRLENRLIPCFFGVVCIELSRQMRRTSSSVQYLSKTCLKKGCFRQKIYSTIWRIAQDPKKGRFCRKFYCVVWDQRREKQITSKSCDVSASRARKTNNSNLMKTVFLLFSIWSSLVCRPDLQSTMGRAKHPPIDEAQGD